MNNRTTRLIVGIVVGFIIVLVAVLAYIWISGGSGEATAETQAEVVETTSSTSVVFDISAADSEVRFLLDEDLQGNRITVTGVTQDVDGQIAVDFTAPANTTLGEVVINVRTLATDNEFRNRALRSAILQSSQDQFQFARFVPTAIEGLPETVTFGEAISFTVTGDFTLRDVTQPVTFEVTVTPVSETRLEGSARAVVNRNDFGLTIPSAPGVANVEEEVELEIDFVAFPVSADAAATPEATAEAGA